MGRLVLVLGGARSGKSSFAAARAKKRGKKVAYVATCEPLDDEMRARIRAHRGQRPKGWKTVEAFDDAAKAVRAHGAECDVVLIDCLTLLISNLFLQGMKEKGIAQQVRDIVKAAARAKAEVVIVTNEVGMAVVPENAMAREFRDIAGRMNQLVASSADEVYLLFAGLPLKLQGRP
jgi:adenosylcobinamide kinase / adenosylcobinamide-phosphate guanylyltransferase